jgi:hypothetical protein
MINYKYNAMKRRVIFYSLLLMICSLQVAAQNPNRERLNSYKIAFFTKRLNLTPQEAERFWPVYNEYQDEKSKIQFQRAELNRNFNQNELNMSDKEMSEAGDLLVSLEVKESELSVAFHKKIKTILSPVKVLRLYQAENQYRLLLLNELRDRNQLRNNRELPQPQE